MVSFALEHLGGKGSLLKTKSTLENVSQEKRTQKKATAVSQRLV